MRLLDISTDLGAGATPAHLDALVTGVRVATDVAHDAETRRIRRATSERMKFPTDRELRDAAERLPSGDEQSPQYRAKVHLDARAYAWSDERRFPPELWFDYLSRRRHSGKGTPSFRLLSDAGYDRYTATAFPFVGPLGLDVLDPILYDALCADELARSLPEEIRIRTLSYENPFLARIFGKGAAESAVSTTAEVIEVARDFGAKRTSAKADAAVAEATVGNRIAESDLDVDLKAQRVIEAQLRNERLALENAQLRQSLGADQQRRRLIDQAIRRGQLDIADAIGALRSGDVRALGDLARRPLELEENWEGDDAGEEHESNE